MTSYAIPNVIAEHPRGERVLDVYSHLLHERIICLGTEIDDGVRQHLRSLGRGCRAVHVPDDIFTYTAEED